MPNDAAVRSIWERIAVLLAWSAAACVQNGPGLKPLDDGSRAWARIYKDSLYEIALDTSRLGFDTRRSNVVYYRTDHALTHHRHGKPWNREVSQSVIRCDQMRYAVAGVDMSLRGRRRPISQQRTPDEDLRNTKQWRPIERGTVEEIAALAACDRIRRRGGAIAAQRR